MNVSRMTRVKVRYGSVSRQSTRERIRREERRYAEKEENGPLGAFGSDRSTSKICLGPLSYTPPFA